MKRDPLSDAKARCGGFSLVELSIVMIIIGLIIAGGVTVFQPSMRQTYKAKNEVIVRHAVDAMIGFSGSYKRLPTTLQSVINSPKDAQNQDLSYAYDDHFLDESSICNRNSAVLSITGSNYTVSDVAFVIWSKGYDGAVSPSKSSGPFSTATAFSVPSYSETKGAVQDDLVGWATLTQLKAAVGCGGSVMKILASELPVGKVDLAYSTTVTFTPDGGLSPYYWCVEFPAALSDKFTFSPSVLQTAFGNCATTANAYVTGTTLTMAPNANTFASTEQGGPYDFVVYLKDSNATVNSVSRRFSFYVNE
ncbi:MAG: prepilin-type N-terminal cleavage/methylation domain-containing protein [Magnetococcales bacterium]|nr:prepilin-type N-terminal cleavage/methylation domain-containing protein [Magnetococcales bacterium]